MSKDPARFTEPKRTTESEINFRVELERYYSEALGSNVEKLQNFPKFVPVQDTRRFLGRYEIFKKVLGIHGSIIECGVLFGGGLMAWAQFSEIFEPVNHLRNIFGFDTFAGFASVDDQDKTATAHQQKVGGLAIDSYEDISRSIALYDSNRLLKHISKVKLVRGDIAKTAPDFLEKHPHLVVSLLWLDFDTYAPTKIALEHFLPRMPKGAIVAFDELNHEVWPGETVAVMESVGLKNLRIERFPWGATTAYAVIE
jgi:hypothetical protein